MRKAAMSVLIHVFWWMLALISVGYILKWNCWAVYLFKKNNLNSRRAKTTSVFFSAISPELVTK